MQVLTGLGHDKCHALNQAGAYEWWYVDAISANSEWAVVMILFRGVPMSADYVANPQARTGGYALSVYHRGKRVRFHFGGVEESLCTFGVSPCDVAVGAHRFRRDHDGVLCFFMDVPGAGKEPGTTVTVRLNDVPGPSSEGAFQSQHGWVLAAPRVLADVSITLREGDEIQGEIEFTSMAYHDHNMGRNALTSDFASWMWGRVHADNHSVVFLSTPDASSPFTWSGTVLADGSIIPWEDAKVVPGKIRTSFMGLRSPRHFTVTGLERGVLRSVECTVWRVGENGPFYQRSLSRWAENGESIGVGMCEYMDVQRLSQTWIRPFLRLPWHLTKM